MTDPHYRHDHAHHHRAPAADADRRTLGLALALITSFMVVEVVAGLAASSLALLSDAGHMLTDAGALGLALVAARLAERPASGGYTFGLKRAEILSAQANGAVLLVLGSVIAYGAVGRLSDPPEVDAPVVIVVGALGALVNVVAAYTLARAERRSLNVEGARQHVLTDLYASLAAVTAGVLILLLDFDRADPLAALLVAALMAFSAFRLLRDSGRVLLEAAPRGAHPDEIGAALARQPGVVEVHDLHVWEVTTGFPALAGHILVAPGDDCHATRRALQELLRESFGIEHTTLQVDHAPRTELLEIEPRHLP